MNPLAMILNAARRIETIFPGYFPEAKHNHYRDFGYPDTVTFAQTFAMYCRNGIGTAGIDRTADKTWETSPVLLEKQRDQGADDSETTIEGEIRQKFEDLRFWQKMQETDRRSLVGSYAGVILRIADDKKFNQPIDTVTAGLDALVEIIPAWEGQLSVGEWDTDQASDTYGQPKMFQFNEASVASNQNQTRAFDLHPDRVIIWSKDGTVHGRSHLEPGYNSLLDLEKISGAGGEGFWKNAKNAPVLQVDKDASLQEMAQAMGVPVDEVADKMDEQVDDWQKGFDKLLMLQGMEAKGLPVNLPSPEHFYGVSLQAFAASIRIPVKILVGSQTGERASTEDSKEWAKTNMSRREYSVIPNVLSVVNRLEAFGILPENDWLLDWNDLTESSMQEKVDRADKMAGVNQKMKETGEIVFTHEEIRDAIDLAPLSETEKYRDPEDTEDQDV